jgi:hypothetical protein
MTTYSFAGSSTYITYIRDLASELSTHDSADLVGRSSLKELHPSPHHQPQSKPVISRRTWDIIYLTTSTILACCLLHLALSAELPSAAATTTSPSTSTEHPSPAHWQAILHVMAFIYFLLNGTSQILEWPTAAFLSAMRHAGRIILPPVRQYFPCQYSLPVPCQRTPAQQLELDALVAFIPVEHLGASPMPVASIPLAQPVHVMNCIPLALPLLGDSTSDDDDDPPHVERPAVPAPVDDVESIASLRDRQCRDPTRLFDIIPHLTCDGQCRRRPDLHFANPNGRGPYAGQWYVTCTTCRRPGDSEIIPGFAPPPGQGRPYIALPGDSRLFFRQKYPEPP